ncbi:hypothetical protein BZA05DRAFT_466843 [Tricharina praecox]|uniref:uncharacterized protein n=1 Tax=Tricharina praecox TaxID=43433 RepID=UPI00221EFBA6|nr:uncharacterized protein BZA05DRAFT_466843 [Tricharina praecox]KAI5854713.1 hypothetical protein BZA05DRAFT_466843 [Tricharina praecox]
MAPSISTPVYCALIAGIYGVYAHFEFFGLTSPLPWSQPKQPLLLHAFLLPQTLLLAALCTPLARKPVAAVFLPPILASFWHLLGTGASSSAFGYAIGTATAFMLFKTLEVLVFRDVRGTYRRYPTCGGEHRRTHTPDDGEGDSEAYPATIFARATWALDLMHALRGVGWNWCVRLPVSRPTGSRTRWLLRRVARGAAMLAWLDVLVWYVRVVDRGFFVPQGVAMGFEPGEGVPYPSLFAGSTKPLMTYPVPAGFPAMPEGGWVRVVYAAALHALRTLLGASAMYTTISGMYTAVALLCVLSGAVLGLPYPLPSGFPARWLAPEAWPDAFGSWRDGDFGAGVRGWWGRGWHGLFRCAFTAPAGWLVQELRLAPSGGVAALLYATVPFAASAALHFAGCWTQSNGGFGAARFFLLQPLGILLEAAVARGWRRVGGHVPWLEKASPYVWTTVWMCVTSTSFFEDYRWGGVWTVEPIPFSVIRGRTDLWVSKQDSGWLVRWVDSAEQGGVMGSWGVLLGGGAAAGK